MKLTLGNQEIEITEEQRQKLITDLMNYPEKADSWPQINDKYFYNDEDGDTIDCTYRNDAIDRLRADIGNVFKTKEEAQAHVRYLKALTRVKGSSSFVPDWNNQDEVKYNILYNHLDYDLQIDNWVTHQTVGVPVFYESREAAEQAIKDHKEDFLILAGVK